MSAEEVGKEIYTIYVLILFLKLFNKKQKLSSLHEIKLYLKEREVSKQRENISMYVFHKWAGGAYLTYCSCWFLRIFMKTLNLRTTILPMAPFVR